MPHPRGTCVLLEVNSIDNLVEYFKNLHKPNVLFELKGIKITVAQFTQVSNMDTCNNTSQSSHYSSRTDNENFNSGQCCAICNYCICFSTVTACNYWNDLTLTAIAEHAMLHYQEALEDGKEFTCDYLPQIVDICGAAVDVVFGRRYQNTLSFTSVSSKHFLKSLISENTSENTGFLLQLSNYWFSGIFQHSNNTRQKTKYVLMACDELSQTIKFCEKFTDLDSVINKIYNIVTQKLRYDKIEYDVQFFSCSCQLSKSEKQKILRNHESTTHKMLLANKSKENYANLEPAKKKIRSVKNVLKYKSMDPTKKKDLFETYAKKYKSMDPLKKENLVETNAKKYKSMDPVKKENLAETKAKKYKSMDPVRKKRSC